MPLVKPAARTLLALSVLAAVQPAPGQQQAAPAQQAQPAQARGQAQGLDPNSFYGKESTEGVYVRDSALALEKFALAQRMERLKEWSKSADLYQEILEKYGDRVVPSQTDKDNKIYQYTSVTKGVQDQLARWPQEGRDVYRARHEAPAAALVEQARRDDLFALNQVFAKYFITDAAKNAGLRLIELNTERGEFLAAAEKGDRLLERHPTITPERPSVLFRTAMAYHLAGDASRAKQRLDELKKAHPDAAGVVRGKEVALATALEAELKVPVQVAVGASADSYPMYGGDPSRGRVSGAMVSPGAPLFSVPLARPQWGALQPQQRQQMEQALLIAEREGMTLGVIPAIDRGELYFQDGRRVYAVSLASGGLPLAGWRQTWGGADRNGQYVLPGTWGAARTYQHTLTLTDDSVLAVMGQPDRRAMDVGFQMQGDTRLVCLDRATGRENWVVAPAMLQVPPGAEGVRQLQLMGSPLVVGDSVLVAGRSARQGQQFEDCWVLCVDLAGGKYRWSSYVASSSAAGAMWGIQAASASDNATHLAYADGRVYVMTNLGALAALDAYSGTTLWLNIYPRNVPQGVDPNMGVNHWGIQQMQQSANNKPWGYNPVIVQQGKLFALPTDGRFLMVYDASSGVEVKRIKLSHLAEADAVLGVTGDRLVVSGDDRIVCLNWPKYDPDNFSDEMLHWRAGPLRFPVRGRGFVTANSVFVPAGDRLFRFDLKLGKIAETYPPYETGRGWEKGSEGPGNVVVTNDYVVIAGDARVDVYTDLSAAKKRLDAEVAAAPGDPQPRLRYAGLLFAAGDSAGSLAKLDEAINLLGGLSSMARGGDRDQVFQDALTFAEKLSASMNPEAQARVVEMYDRAAAAADAPSQQVRYRLSRAKLAEARKDAATAVRLYQEILSDPKLRPESLADEAGGGLPTQAAAVAERSIANVIRQAGFAVYEPFQKAAAAALAEAQKTREPAKLLAVAQVYPNSTVAPQAMLAAADAYESAGDHKAAVNVLRPMYFKYPDSPEKLKLIEAMARNYLALPYRVDTAAARLAQGTSLPGEPKLSKPLKLPDGKVLEPGVTFASALEEVRRYTGREASKSLPDFRLPPQRRRTKEERQADPHFPFLAHGPNTTVNDVTALVPPLREFYRPDRFVTWTRGRGLSVYPAAKTQPLGTSDAVAEQPQRVAWLEEGLLVWGQTQVHLLPPDGGAPKWVLDVSKLPTLEVVRTGDVAQAAAAPPGFNGPGGFGGAQIIVRNNQQFMIRNGVMQPLVPPPVAQRPAAGAAEQVADVRPVGDRVLVATTTGRVLSAEVPTGRVAWQTRLSDRAADRLVATEDFTVVRTSDETAVRLVALDTFTGEHVGTKPFPTQVGLVPMNLAMSADGTLVYTLQNALVLKDLYKPWNEQGSEKSVPGPAQQPPYTGATRPDQLVIAEGRILALADGGPAIGVAPDKYVRLHSLETGMPLPLRYRTGKGDEQVDRVLTTYNKTWDVSLRVVGSHLYVVGSRAVVSYNLDRPAESWRTHEEAMNIRDAFIGQNYLAVLEQPEGFLAAAAKAQADAPAQQGEAVVVPPGGAVPVPLPRPVRPGGAPGAAPVEAEGQAQPAARAEKPPTSYRLRIHRTSPASETNPAQSGKLDYLEEITDPAGITAWQPIDGGFCYTTGDGKLKMLLGAGK